MKRAAVVAGIFFGIVMGAVQGFQAGTRAGSWSVALTAGLVLGLISGVLFGGALYLFVNSRWIKKQIALDPADLIAGEIVYFSSPANLVVRPKDFGLQKFAFDQLLWTVGMKDKEALGGSLHVTNCRLVFKSHKLNRLRGKTSIFLPIIRDVTNASFFVFQRIVVSTMSTKVEFVVLDPENVIRHIRRAQADMAPAAVEALKQEVLRRPSAFGDGLEAWSSINTLNNLINLGGHAKDVTEVIASPLGALAAIFMKELVDETVAEWWQKKWRPGA
jgi:hypothetical protein